MNLKEGIRSILGKLIPIKNGARKLNRDEFELKYRRLMDEGGHSYDPWDIACSWNKYQNNPDEHWINRR